MLLDAEYTENTEQHGIFLEKFILYVKTVH